MTRAMQIGLAERYLVDDLPGSIQIGARLNGILLEIDAGGQLTKLSRQFLASNGLHALDALVGGQLAWDAFQGKAELERAERMQQAAAKAVREAAELAERAAAKAAAVKANFAALANDPDLRRKREAKALRQRFGVGYIEGEHYRRVMVILKCASNRQRLKAEDVAWLRTEADYCWTDELQKVWHALEAEALTKAWEGDGDAWHAVNASGHWRKAGEPGRALVLTEAALAKTASIPKLRSALATTRGGAMRDLRRLEEAKVLASEAHDLTPRDYRPCTLLGAVHIELGDLTVGHAWYAKAEKLGASRFVIDQELRALLARSALPERQRICAFLLDQDPERFSWLNRWADRRAVTAHSESVHVGRVSGRTAMTNPGRHDYRSR